MKCPDLEDVIAFAVSPLDPDQAEIAAHIYCCDICRRIAADASRGLLDRPADDDVPFPGIGETVKEWEKRKHKGQRADLISRISALISGCSVPVVPSGIRPGMVFLNSSNVTGGKREPVRITFTAGTARDCENYWEAEVVIPADVSDSTMLDIFLKDRDQCPVIGGSLTLLGERIMIFNGRGEMLFRRFRENLENTDVSFTDLHGHKTVGDLSIL